MRNDIHREAAARSLRLDGIRMRAEGGSDPGTWRCLGITYSVELTTDAPPAQQDALLAAVDEVAEIPRTLREATTVRRT